MQCYIGFCTPTRTQMKLKKKKGFRHSASSSAFAELHCPCPCPCHPHCHPNNGCEVLNDSCGQEAIASMQSQSVSQSPTTSQICHLHFLDFSPCPWEPLDLMTFFSDYKYHETPVWRITVSSASRPYGKSPAIDTEFYLGLWLGSGEKERDRRSARKMTPESDARESDTEYNGNSAAASGHSGRGDDTRACSYPGEYSTTHHRITNRAFS